MSAGNFDKCVTYTLEFEGGLSENPYDPGGKTKYGISAAFHPDVDIENLTIEGAKEIYKAEYWDTSGCETLPAPLDFAVFDAAVQHGPSTAKSILKLSNGSWEHFNILRINRYVRFAKANSAAKVNFFWGWMNRMYQVNVICDNWETTHAEPPIKTT